MIPVDQHFVSAAPGPFYRQFYFNPFLFNPAYVAINNELEANLDLSPAMD